MAWLSLKPFACCQECTSLPSHRGLRGKGAYLSRQLIQLLKVAEVEHYFSCLSFQPLVLTSPLNPSTSSFDQASLLDIISMAITCIDDNVSPAFRTIKICLTWQFSKAVCSSNVRKLIQQCTALTIGRMVEGNIHMLDSN